MARSLAGARLRVNVVDAYRPSVTFQADQIIAGPRPTEVVQLTNGATDLSGVSARFDRGGRLHMVWW